jgi:hypothetical protein
MGGLSEEPHLRRNFFYKTSPAHVQSKQAIDLVVTPPDHVVANIFRMGMESPQTA